MHPEADAEVRLSGGEAFPPSPVASFGFICTFGDRSFSAAVVPDGTAALVLRESRAVRLRFLVPTASEVLIPGTTFTFFEQHRVGEGRILTRAV